MRNRPGRSVTSMRPSGRKASDHGCDSPETTVSTWMLPAEERNVWPNAGVVTTRSASTDAYAFISLSEESRIHIPAGNASRLLMFRPSWRRSRLGDGLRDLGY